MKILLDESLPRKLKNYFGTTHQVWTVRDKDWLGKKNGDLLNLMVENGFELFITVDKNLPFQQNTSKLPLHVCVLNALDNRLETLAKLIPKLFDTLSKGNLQKVFEIS